MATPRRTGEIALARSAQRLHDSGSRVTQAHGRTETKLRTTALTPRQPQGIEYGLSEFALIELAPTYIPTSGR